MELWPGEADPTPVSSVENRLHDLEHDNNLMRELIANIQSEQSLSRYNLEKEWNDISKKISKLVQTVNDCVSRFSRVN